MEVKSQSVVTECQTPYRGSYSPPPYNLVLPENHHTGSCPITWADQHYRSYNITHDDSMNGFRNSFDSSTSSVETTHSSWIHQQAQDDQLEQDPYAELPQYSIGAQITPTVLTPEETRHTPLTIQLTPQVSLRQPGCYDLGDIIQGMIVFVPWKMKFNSNQHQDGSSSSSEEEDEGPEEQMIASVGIVLESFEITNGKAGIASNEKTQLNYYNVPSVAFPSHGMVRPGFVYKFPFSMQIPDARPSPCGCECPHEHTQLAPSFGAPAHSLAKEPGNSSGVPNNAARIYYRLGAFVKWVKTNPTTNEKSITTLCRGYQDIKLFPSYSLIDQSLFMGQSAPSQYVSSKPEAIKLGRMWHSKGDTGIMSVRMPGQPIALALDTPFSTSVSVEANFSISLPSHQQASSHSFVPPKIQKVSLELVSKTTYSLVDQPLSTSASNPEFAKYLKEVSQSTQIAQLDSSSSSTNNQELQWSPLIGEVGSTLLQSKRLLPSSLSYNATMNIPLSWKADDMMNMTPSFESCSITRGYYLVAKVFVQGLKLPISVQVPVRVVPSLVARSNVPGCVPLF